MDKMTRTQRRKIELAKCKELKKARKKAKQELNEELIRSGYPIQSQKTVTNSKSRYQNVEEEERAGHKAAENFIKTIKRSLPGLLKRLSEVKDYRNPKKLKHKVDVVLLFGILSFVFQKASRREANREMTAPIIIENLGIFFPELDSLPHQDTLNRFLSKVEIKEIESIPIELIKDFIKKKKFRNYLIDKSYPIAMDGSQKYTYDFLWAEECQRRKINGKMQYYCYTLEASLVFHNGMTIPLATEFLDYMQGDDTSDKQDSETKAFKRLAERIKGYFPKLRIMVLLDGLYPNGPIMELCRKYEWDFMIVLKEDSLSSVWEEYFALKDLDKDNIKIQKWGSRKQNFIWVNDIIYSYGKNEKNLLSLHVVVCKEEWEEIAPNSTARIKKNKKHAWISSKPLNKQNLHERCNLGARYRWGIENGFLVEKKCGYQYEHAFSFNWNAMKGYHLLMRIAHMINVLAEYGNLLRYLFIQIGMMAAIKFIDETFRKFILNRKKILESLAVPCQVRFA